ncbi:uncharacterized protein LOC113079594 [Tachysurus ichikawai]
MKTSQGRVCSSRQISSKTSSKGADAEAELAAKIEQAKAMQEIYDQQARLHKMENDWKVKEAKKCKQRLTKGNKYLPKTRGGENKAVDAKG